jgi:tryptophan synthase alpha chain
MISLMAHMIPFYPDESSSREIALAMLEEGVRFLEVQFAFSDPGADGPVIEAACQSALHNGFTVDHGFEFIEDLRERSGELARGEAEVFLMTYASIIYTRGIDQFCRRAAAAGVSGLIVPDLPLDSDEGLLGAAAAAGLEVIPVLAASSRPERIELAKSIGSKYIYCALRSGITGAMTELGEGNLAFLRQAGSGGAAILAGFGISTREQVAALDGSAEAAVVGSAFLRAVHEGYRGESGAEAVRALVRHLTGVDN